MHTDHSVEMCAHRIRRGFAPCVKHEPAPSKTPDQHHAEELCKGSALLLDGMNALRAGEPFTAPRRLKWSHHAPAAVEREYKIDPPTWIIADNRICTRCGAKSGGCDHSEWLLK